MVRHGTLSWNGTILEMDNHDKVSEWLKTNIVSMGLFSGGIIHSKAYRKFFLSEHFDKIVRKVHCETVLATIFSVPCVAHYYWYGFAYRTYVKCKSHRAVMSLMLLSEDDLFKLRKRLTKIAEFIKTEEGTESESVELAVVNAMAKASGAEDIIRCNS